MPRPTSIRRALACILASHLLLSAAHGALITQTVNAGASTTWNGNFWGSPAGAPTTGNTYVTATGLVSADSNLRLPYSSITGRIRDAATASTSTLFAGDSLTIVASTELLMKQQNGTATADIILDGGLIRFSPDLGGNSILAGTLEIASASVMGIVLHQTGSLTINSTLTGSAALRIAAGASSGTGQTLSMIFNGDLTGYSGEIDVGGDHASSRSLVASFTQNYYLPNLSLTFGKYATADVLNLTNNIQLGSFTFGANALGAGTYNSTELNELFGTGSQFTGLGTLTVIPEPGSFATLLGAGGMLLALGFRRRHVRQAT